MWSGKTGWRVCILYINYFVLITFLIDDDRPQCINSLTNDYTYLARSLKELEIEDGPAFLRALDIASV